MRIKPENLSHAVAASHIYLNEVIKLHMSRLMFHFVFSFIFK